MRNLKSEIVVTYCCVQSAASSLILANLEYIMSTSIPGESSGDDDLLSDTQAYLHLEAYEKAQVDLQKATDHQAKLNDFINATKKVL